MDCPRTGVVTSSRDWEDAVHWDTTGALKAKAFKPGDPNNDGDSLKIRCSFNEEQIDFVTLTKLKLYSVEADDDEETMTALGSLTSDDSYGLNRKEISITGKYRVGEEFRSKLDLTWVSSDSGYCTVYKCVATGRDPNNGKLLAVYKTVHVDAEDGGSCS
ncbi:hypothetical protein PoB_002031500 [Plakobranchus ocellatus]|uniref:Uncharacterized protein n=1 Tax=Plakobranchus ocellatus TaxID=259542 RepID=A0AAV3ZF96_9GAST|nr:hypothetical protein PoB_002031500 [Plakobranchus ocellatus]